RTASGEAHEADALRVESPLRGVGAGEAESALRIHDGAERLERHGSLLVEGIALRASGHSILHDGGCKAQRVQPFRHFRALEVPREDAESATGADEHGAAVGLVLWREEQLHLRRADIAEFDNPVADRKSVV